uniref:non-specific serine/threonine protein kinase n=1 Tax=Davidia involucrata TaxID=16924 RepID=A0A5B7BVW8_DAVIN
MGPQFLQSSILYTIFLMLIIVPASYCADASQQFTNCSSPYNCGSMQGLRYPFWGGDRPTYCGRQEFQLYCQDHHYPIVEFDSQKFRVLRINQSIHTMTIARDDLWNDTCPEKFYSTALDSSLFKYAETVTKLNIFYGCTSQVMATVQVQSNITCPINGSGSGVFFADQIISDSVVKGCNISILVPLLRKAYNGLWDGKLTLQQALNQGFDVEYVADLVNCLACESSGGICGSGDHYFWEKGYKSAEGFLCFCPDQNYPQVPLECSNYSAGTSTSSNMRLKWAIGAPVAGMGILLTSILICYFRFKASLYKKKTNDDQNIEAFIKQYGSLAPKRYSYSDVKKMTNFLKDKLGQGGYGGVYKGKLFDGRLVAVKILNASKGNGEEFINEVASISRTSHVNIVALLGFCFEGSKRALIYEFMPNGSLEKFIYSEGPLKARGKLGWDKLYQIAIGIARGLEYLHSGCSTRILHFDIKPHNILLDEDFCPKISDFGLAKLCNRKESIVSMLEARGTIGYIAPEVFSRTFGGVSHKSDVYSYGMMILEMVGGRKNIDVGVGDGHTSEIYFPHWIYKRLELDEELGLQGEMNKEENEIARKMILVGLWCIQTDPSQRPAISTVMDMLEGSIEALEIPPKPFLCSPSRSVAVADSSTTSVIL